MAQAVIPKASLEEICLGGGLIVGGLLASLDINDDNIISGITNFIPSPSHLWCVVKKPCEGTFMSIVWFVFNYPCSMPYNNGGSAGIGRLVKEMSFWGGE